MVGLMDLDGALAQLGLDRTATVADARRAYRQALRRVHPDVQPPSARAPEGDATERIGELLAAMETIAAASGEDGSLPQAAAVSVPSPTDTDTDTGAEGSSLAGGVDIGEDPTSASVELRHDPTGPPLFWQLHQAFDEIGDVTYADRNLGLLAGIVRQAGQSLQLAVQLSTDSGGAVTAAFTLEAIDAGEAPPIERIVQSLADHL